MLRPDERRAAWTTLRIVHRWVGGDRGLTRTKPGYKREWTMDSAVVHCPKWGLIGGRQNHTGALGPLIGRPILLGPAPATGSKSPPAAFG